MLLHIISEVDSKRRPEWNSSKLVGMGARTYSRGLGGHRGAHIKRRMCVPWRYDSDMMIFILLDERRDGHEEAYVKGYTSH